MESLVEGLKLIAPWIERLSARRAGADDAVRSVLLAVNATSAHIADDKRGYHDRAQERSLVQLWTEAAVAIRRYDPEFAQLLQTKAQYWCDPSKWSDDDVARAGISIKAVAARARSFLGGAV